MHLRRLIAATLFTAVLVLAVAPAAAQSRWDGERRFTILVLGMDRRPGARDTLNVRTDTILLISIDPSTDSVGVLHFPRDLHIAGLDTTGLLRINTLLIRGEEVQENYGPFYAMDTIGFNTGMFIDAFIAFDFEAFISLIDALGGIEVDNPYIINDPTYPDMNYGFDPFYLSSGTHLLDGKTALKYARTRHGDNDYERGERQMQVFTATAVKATDASALPGLLQNAPQLMEDFKGHVYTDLTLDELIPLALFGARVPLDHIFTGSLSGEYMARLSTDSFGTTTDTINREILPDLLREVFGPDYAG